MLIIYFELLFIMHLSKKLLEFYPFDNAILVRRRDSNKVLRINPSTNEAEEVSEEAVMSLKPLYKTTIEIDAIFGIVPLVHENYIVYVKRSVKVAEVMNRPIYQAIEMDFIAMTAALREKEGDKQHIHRGKDKMFQRLFLSLLNTSSFYFSETYDLTNSLQKQSEFNFDLLYADQNFLVNRPYIVTLMQNREANLVEYFPIFIHGLVEQEEIAFKPRLRLTVISRKEMRRIGVRYYSRGIDDMGHVSNYAETEQIWEECEAVAADPSRPEEASRRIFSFQQIRGSIPIFWSQVPSLNYTPRIKMDERVRSESAYALHFARIVRKYKACHIVNLIDKKKIEQLLGKEFELLHEKLAVQQPQEYAPNVSFQWFDYHSNCKGGNFSKLHSLISEDEKILQSFGHFQAFYSTPNSNVSDSLTFPLTNRTIMMKVISKQSGIVRTNCMDCLDRTNVVQSFLAKYDAFHVLQKMGLYGPFETVLRPLPGNAEATFRKIWSANADRLSHLYAGTPALKTDITRYGKRMYSGVVNDAKNSLTRYIINNFYDSERQNVYDLLTKNMVKSHPFYEANSGANFIKTSTLLLLMPWLVRMVFWILNRRFNSILGRVFLLMGLCTLAFYIAENKKTVLQGHIIKF